MAEAIVNTCYPKWKAYSAGTRPAGYVHPKAIQALEEIGIAHSGQSKQIDELHTKDFDLVVTVCTSAIYLLNPKVVTKDGEREAWFFANWLPGTIRYRSFRDLMKAEYQKFLKL